MKSRATSLAALDTTRGPLGLPVGDVALLAAAHLGGRALNGQRILSSESAAEMQRIITPGKKFDLGLGWFRRHRDSKGPHLHRAPRRCSPRSYTSTGQILSVTGGQFGGMYA